MQTWYTRSEALAALGVRAQTLYSYASRGRIGVAPDPANPRRSLYRREDIEELLKRRARGRRPAAIAASTISWGEPIITTAISTIANGRLYYRGQDAIDLSLHTSLEEIAALLWGESVPPRLSGGRYTHTLTGPPLQRAINALAELGSTSHPIHGRAPVALRTEAARLIDILASAFGAISTDATLLHRRLSMAWGADDTASDLIRRALVLLADQELTTSAFTARVVASTGATLASCVVAGLAGLSGPLHGGATNRVRSLFDDVDRLGPHGTVAHYLARGLQIPGFGHALYPEGDPRAAALLGAFSPADPFETMIAEVYTATGQRPTIDVALEALRATHRLPDDAPFALFAVARSVGMIAHAIEQNHVGTLIRPRAKYIGAISSKI